MYYMYLDLQKKYCLCVNLPKKGVVFHFITKFCIIELYTPSGDFITFKCAQIDNLYLVGTCNKVDTTSSMVATLQNSLGA